MKTLVSTKGMSREDWLEFRNTGIGGSDVSVICGLNKYKSVVELWMEKSNNIEASEAGEAAYWGSCMEPLIRNEFTKRTGLDVEIQESIFQHPEHDFMLANLDGIIHHPEHGDCVFEAKTSSVYRVAEWEDKIPDEYMLQIQHYMAVTGLDTAFVAVLIGGNEFRYYCIERDEELINMLITLETEFWENVVNHEMPAVDGSDACAKTLLGMFPTSNETQTVLPDEASDLITQYETASASEKAAGELKDEASNKLKQMLGDFETGVSASRIVSWKSVITERLDSKRFKAEKPELYAEFVNTTSSRRFSIK